MFLADLPYEHPLRNRPVAGLYHRWHCWNGEDITIDFKDRDDSWRWWGASAWGYIKKPCEAKNPRPIAHMTYNELESCGGFWTKSSDWSTDKQPKRKQGELNPPNEYGQKD